MVSIGERFGSLVVVNSYMGYMYKNKQRLIDVVCDCGTTKTIPEAWVLYNNVKSCGCKRNDGHSHLIHGGRGTRLYQIWKSMNERCNTPSYKNYKNYGARNIKICEEWKDFSAFRDWANANGYNDNLTIDRINVDGDYCPSNCRWATYSQQARNKRNTKKITYKGETKPLADFAEQYGISYATLYSRLCRGWSVDRALTTSTRT